eukprot:gene32622-42255_t
MPPAKSNALAKANEHDTLLSIHVLEHVQDAFRYMTGGRLIFHERYYNTTTRDGDLYHP